MENLKISHAPQKQIEYFEDKKEICLLIEAEKVLSGSPAAKEALENMKKHDQVTYNHLISMVNLASRLAAEFDFSEGNTKLLLEACAVHDIGKEYINPEILNKKGKLTQEEFEEIKTHPVIGAKILNSKMRRDLADIIILHHALKGNKNPYPAPEEIEETLPGHAERIKNNPKLMAMAQILADIDKADALLAPDRPYKESFSREKTKFIVGLESTRDEEIINWIVENSRPGTKPDYSR